MKSSWKFVSGALGLAALLVSPSTLSADGTSPGGLRGTLRAKSADTAGRGTLEFGLFSSFHTLEDDDGSRHWFFLEDFQAGYGLSPYVEVGAVVPLRLWFLSSDQSPTGATNHGGFGDVSVSGKFNVPLSWNRLRLGAMTRVSFPTGSTLRGFTTNSTDFEVDGLLTLNLTDLDGFIPTRLHLNGGYRWNRREDQGFGVGDLRDVESIGFWPPAYPARPLGESDSFNDQLLLRFGLEFSTRLVDLFTEFSADVFPNISGLDFRDQPVFLTQGALVKFRNGINLKGAIDVSLQKGDHDSLMAEIPDVRLWLGVQWQMSLSLGDRDHDGVPDDHDLCPSQSEDFDGFEDDDGCPDFDNDGDGIPDRDDLAPDLPEDFDGFEDEDGRPDLDNDQDGISDADDQCPNEPEDYDGDRDTDGCPDVEAGQEGESGSEP